MNLLKRYREREELAFSLLASFAGCAISTPPPPAVYH
jgi:hypothetical protein